MFKNQSFIIFTAIFLLFSSLVFCQQQPQAAQVKSTQQTVSGAHKIIKLGYANSVELVKILQKFAGNTKIEADERLNAIQVYGSKEETEEMEKIIKSADTSNDQILIEAPVVEISKSVSSTIGIEYSKQYIDIQTIIPPEQLTTASIPSIIPALIHYGGENAEAKILATPKLLVDNGKEATIKIIDKIPIPITTSSITSGGQVVSSTAIQFEEVGIKLKVKPIIYSNNEVTIKLTCEVSTVGKVTAQGYPEIGSRTVETDIKLKDEYTAILGGLIKEEERLTRSGIPLLMDIPLLGLLFSKTDTEKVITEIRIGIKPKIIKAGDKLPQPPKEEKK
ncbi:MAG: hypothetical protein A2536_09215 [Candidatus Firestonebacteria bacterium RIFOXYD2_FULL_39_29]|nr:MAG: hypothetical protein A2536_09215 [Candidatus Firestonebacteria bacterium RIFOXYD2_FULL_39_29]